MSELEVYQFRCRSDNYGYLLHDPDSGATAAIDTPDGAAVVRALDHTGWSLSHILNTHHHFDHVDGNLELKANTGCRIIGGHRFAEKIPGLDETVGEGDFVSFGAHKLKVLETPGHTLGHIVYVADHPKLAFTGDTLFSLGCGRLFEGTSQQMWTSLQKLLELPQETLIYCAHEYSLSNAEFALEIEPENDELQDMAERIRNQCRQRQPTVPTLLSEERAANPFLRPDSAVIRKRLGMENAADDEVFAEIRRRKDAF